MTNEIIIQLLHYYIIGIPIVYFFLRVFVYNKTNHMYSAFALGKSEKLRSELDYSDYDAYTGDKSMCVGNALLYPLIIVCLITWGVFASLNWMVERSRTDVNGKDKE